MTRDILLEQLRNTQGFNYIGDSTEYGVSGVHCYISDEGVTWLGTLTGGEVIACPILRHDEYIEAKKHIHDDSTDESDDHSIQMVKANCSPGIQYWRLGNELLLDDEPEFYIGVFKQP